MPFLVSTVGRMLKCARDRKEIVSACQAANRRKDKRRRAFKGHVTRLRYGIQPKEIGALIQIDHMSVQVDEGSEFRGAFEEKALEMGLKAYVLPARKPQLNGMVERFNRTLRDVFYSRYGRSAGEVSKALEVYIRHDNEEKCHTAIGVPPHFYA